MLSDDAGWCGCHEAVSLLAPGADVGTEPLVPFSATSAAAGMAGNFLGRLQAALPHHWPETHWALTVDSASWPQPIGKHLVGRSAHWKTGSRGARQGILREMCYGIPDIGRAVLLARNDVTLIAKAEIQPFARHYGSKPAEAYKLRGHPETVVCRGGQDREACRGWWGRISRPCQAVSRTRTFLSRYRVVLW